MGVSLGKTGSGEIVDINMTPMIDVLLVLLVIFIIVQQQLQRAFDIQLPIDQPNQPAEANPDNIVMEIGANGSVNLNTQVVDPSQLEARLRQIYANRPRKVIFVKASAEVEYGTVIDYIDMARAAGVTVVGAVLQPALAGAPAQ